MTTVATPVALPQDLMTTFESERRFPFPFLLESALPSVLYGKQTLFGSNPFAVLRAKGIVVDLWREGQHERFEGDPFDFLRTMLDDLRSDDDPENAFPGLAVGYFGYDLGSHIERLPNRAKEDQDFPDLLLAFYDRFLRVDHDTGKAEVIDWDDRRRKRAMNKELYREFFDTDPREAPSNFTHEQYRDAVKKARDYIEAGDIYQVNLSQRFAVSFPGNPYELYQRLRKASPAMYAAYLEFGNHALLSSSPEEFIRVEKGTISTRPIKGTRPRGRNQRLDEKMRSELHASRKDDAELAMIVDLERNDLGRVCEYGSVSVTQPKILETHPTVFHLSSRIEGRLQKNKDLVDVLRATFPGGSVTGAPKIRAMEIIDELEPTRRAAYTGAIGYLTFDGRMDTSIAIRTIHTHGNHATFQVGGAIIWDSDPEDEYQETLVKARGMAKALGLTLE